MSHTEKQQRLKTYLDQCVAHLIKAEAAASKWTVGCAMWRAETECARESLELAKSMYAKSLEADPNEPA